MLLADVKEQESEAQKAGVVILQTPPADERVPRQSKISLVIAKSAQVTVPDVLRMPLERAREEIRQAGLKPGKVEERESARPAGTVIAQSPQAAERVAKGKEIELVTARAGAGGEAPPAPSVAKQPEKEEAVAPPPERTTLAPATSATAKALAPALPRIGDTWTYRYTSGWRNVKSQTFVHRVTAVSESAVHESASMAGSADVHVFSGSVAMIERQFPGHVRQEFAPFLQAFSSLDAGQSWKGIPGTSSDSVYQWYVTGKVLGPEKVTVPAGAFDAIKIEISGNRPFSGGPAQTETEPVRLKHQIWYAPKVKRVVKHARNTYAPKGNDLDRDLYELMEYRLN